MGDMATTDPPRRLGRHHVQNTPVPRLQIEYARQWGRQQLLAAMSEWDGPYLTSDTLGDSVGHAGMPGLPAPRYERNHWPAAWPTEDEVLARYRQITPVIDMCGMPTVITPPEADQLAEHGLVQADVAWDHQYRPGHAVIDLEQLAAALLRNLEDCERED
jgi:hypothetical protein